MLKGIVIFVVLISIILFLISRQLIAAKKIIGYFDISDFNTLKENNCQKCNINIGENTLYKTLYLGKFRYDDRGTSEGMDEKILVRLCKECSKKYEFIDTMLIFSTVDNTYKSMDTFDRSDLAKCFSCKVKLGHNPYYVIDAREERIVNNEVQVLDTVAVLQLCENCIRKYDLSKIKLGIYK